MSCITQLITRWKQNDEHALNQLIAISYCRLRTSAKQALGYYGNNASIQATELVSELYLHFRQQKDVNYCNAQQFFAVATLKMRQILSTRHERNSAQKRSGGIRENSSEIENIPAKHSSIERLILNDCLDFVKNIEPVNSRIAELKLLWEFDNAEIAEILGVSESTVNRKWKATKSVIARKIKENGYCK